MILWAAFMILADETTNNVIQSFGLVGGLSGIAALIGGIVAWRKFTVEKRDTETRGIVSIREVGAEELKAAFPGGVGDIIAHWRNEYQLVTEQLEQTREDCENVRQQERASQVRIHELEMNVDNIGAQLRMAKARITMLELELEEERKKHGPGPR
jgi:hypothetical protein